MLGCALQAKSTGTMNDDAYPRRAEALEINEAEDGLVIYDPSQDTVHHLNPSASMIFDLCDGTRDAETIARTLAEAYGLDAPPTAEAFAGLADLAERKLIHWEPHGAGA
jgi:hypothetical protein